MKSLVTSDLHLTSRPQDAYRFDLFPWLYKIARKGFDAVMILGDLTNSKDRHPSVLVNRIVSELIALRDAVQVFILMGNHDYVDPSNPFFGFLDKIPGIHCITTGGATTIGGKKVLFIPHTKNPERDFPKRVHENPTIDYIFMHHTFQGALASNGMKMEGIPASEVFGKVKAKIFSGDIHVPQKLGPVEYVGAPYQINFGDTFDPRVILLDEKRQSDLQFNTLKKHLVVIKDPDELYDIEDLVKGDQVKVRLALPRSEFVEWSNHKRRVISICNEMEVHLFGIELSEKTKRGKAAAGQQDQIVTPSSTPEEAFDRFCKKEKIEGDIMETGRTFLT